ncbi:MAG: RNA polymerase sigma factor [Planctomycetales bacterium]|nr:RNA polymerase sigma factor [Planctomycetales bacterium]
MATSLSLLDKIKGDRSSERWHEFLECYSPMMDRWLRAHGIPEHDREEIVQDICAVMVRRLPDFERQREGSFRKWLRLTTVNCMRDFWKRSCKQARGNAESHVEDLINGLNDRSSSVSQLWEREHDQQLLAILLARIKPEFRSNTWSAFTMVALEQMAPEKVAENLGLTTNAVFVAKSKVMKRMREEGQGLLDP